MPTLPDCFVMLTNVPIDGGQGYDSTGILRTYKDQQGVERNYSFLKDDQIVNALFLKRNDRIEVLGLILLIALLIWRLMEHQMRSYLQQHEATVPGWDNKPTQRPTSYMLTIKFKGILILRVGPPTNSCTPPLRDAKCFFRDVGCTFNGVYTTPEYKLKKVFEIMHLKVCDRVRNVRYVFK